MQQPSSSTVLRGSLAAGLLRKTSRLRGVIQLTFALGLSLLAALIFATPACGQAYSSTNYWTGLAGSPDWPMAANWSNHIAPTATSFVVLTNYGATGFPAYGMGAIGTPNIVINEDTTVGSLWIVNTNLTGDDAGFHTIQLNNGATLTLSNNASFDGGNVTNILQVCSQAGHTGQWGVQNGLANQAIYGTIQGEGASLVVICTNGLTGIPYQRGNIFVSQGALGLSAAPTEDPCKAILDLSGLDRFVAHVNHICVAADPGSTPFYFHRAAGTLYLAKTNELTLWAQGNAPSGAAINQGLLAGMIALNNGSPLTRVGRVYLGLTNAIFCDTGLGVGIRNSSGWLGFNPLNLPGDSAAFFRDRAGTGRQNMWAVGNRLGVTATGGSDTKGELDFTAGTVDALVNQLQIGKSASNLKTYGVVSLSAGVLDVNTLQLGYQTTAGNAEAQGTLNVNNTAVVKINTSAVLGYLAGNPVSGQEYFGRLNIADGGTVELGSAAPLTCGVGGSRSEIRVVNGSSLKAHHMGAPGAPLTYLQLAGSTLTLDQGALPNPTAPMCSVTTLETTGPVTINVYGTTLLAGTITLIKYDTWNGNFSDLVLGSTPNITGYLTHNVANASIDLVITEGSSRALKWNGRAQGVDTGDWDIGVTAAWQGDLVYQQAGVVGDQVEFDDTAAGTTRVVLADDQLAPLLILVDNQTKNYEFTGAGALTGSGGLTKKGSGTLTLANTGDNTFGGPVNLEGGVLRQDGLADRLPTNAVVTLANAGGVTLDLNGFDLQLGSLSGGGAVNLGAGNLSLGAGGGNFAGVISGSGALIKNTAGTQILSGANTYSGGTVVTGSSLVVTNSTGSGLGSGPVTIGPGGILQLGNGVVEGHIDATEIYNDGRLNLFPATDQTFTKTVTGAGVLAKMLGNGTTLVFNHANDYAGGTIIYQGTVLAAHPEALGTGPITVGNWTATDTMLAVSGDITLTNAIVLSGKTGALVPSPVGVNNVFDPTTYQAGTNTLSGPITLAGATCWAVGSDAGLLIVNGGLVNNQNGPLCQFFLRGSAEGVWNSALKDASTANRLMLEKTDAGTWTVASTNTFTGRTLVSDGKLILTGALNGSSNVVVKSGATLAGTGWITGAVTNSGTIDLSDDDVLRPLTVNGVYLMDYLATVKLSVGPEGNDSIGGMTLCVLDGILEVVLEGPLTGNAVFKLFDAAAYEGAFAGYDLPDITPLSWDTSSLAVDGTLRVTGGAPVVPEISHVSYTEAGGLVLSGSGPLVGNFIVLASDDVAAPLADWTEVGQGTFSNGTFTFTDPTATDAPQRFYRVMIVP